MFRCFLRSPFEPLARTKAGAAEQVSEKLSHSVHSGPYTLLTSAEPMFPNSQDSHSLWPSSPWQKPFMESPSDMGGNISRTGSVGASEAVSGGSRRGASSIVTGKRVIETERSRPGCRSSSTAGSTDCPCSETCKQSLDRCGPPHFRL